MKTTGPIALVPLATAAPPIPAHKGLYIHATSSVPTLAFKVTGTGTAKVTITYNVSVRTVEDDTATTDVDEEKIEWKKDFRTLTLNIVPSS